MYRPDGLKRLPDSVAEALVKALATLPDPARDDRLLLRPTTKARDVCDVLCRGQCVGRIVHSWPGGVRGWTWSITGGANGSATSRDEAMAAFRAAWDARQAAG